MSASKGEDLLAQQLADERIPFIRQHRFHPTRRWLFDFALPDHKLAIEVEGGTWVRGRHTRGSGYEKDREKYSEAAVLGWKVIRVTTGMVTKKKALDFIRRALAKGDCLQ